MLKTVNSLLNAREESLNFFEKLIDTPQAVATLLGISISATVALIVLVIQINAQRKRDREKEIAIELKSSLKVSDQLFMMIRVLNVSLEIKDELLQTLKKEKSEKYVINKEVEVDTAIRLLAEELQPLYETLSLRIEVTNQQLDKLNLDSLPPRQIFGAAIRIKFLIETYCHANLMIRERKLPLTLEDVEHSIKESRVFRARLKSILFEIYDEASSLLKQVDKLYSKKEVAKPNILRLDKESLLTDVPEEWNKLEPDLEE